TSEFVAPQSLPEGLTRVAERRAALASIERAIDEEVYRLYDISPSDRASIEADLTPGDKAAPESEDTPDAEKDDTQDGTQAETATGVRAEAMPDAEAARASLAERWVSYAVGIVLGRFTPGEAGALGAGDVTPEVGAK